MTPYAQKVIFCFRFFFILMNNMWVLFLGIHCARSVFGAEKGQRIIQGLDEGCLSR